MRGRGWRKQFLSQRKGLDGAAVPNVRLHPLGAEVELSVAPDAPQPPVVRHCHDGRVGDVKAFRNLAHRAEPPRGNLKAFNTPRKE